MSYGLKVYDATGAITFDSDDFSLRLLRSEVVAGAGSFAVPEGANLRIAVHVEPNNPGYLANTLSATYAYTYSGGVYTPTVILYYPSGNFTSTVGATVRVFTSGVAYP